MAVRTICKSMINGFGKQAQKAIVISGFGMRVLTFFLIMKGENMKDNPNS